MRRFIPSAARRPLALSLLALAAVSCSTMMEGDAGTDAPRADVPLHADVQPDIADRDDGPLDVIEDRVMDVIDDFVDVPAPIDVADVTDTPAPQDVPEDVRPGQDAMTCNCPAPARDTTTFSIGSLAMGSGSGTPLTPRMDYSVASASSLPKLANNQARIVWSLSASWYDTGGRIYVLSCGDIYTNASGMRVATPGGGMGTCSFAVRDPLDAVLASGSPGATNVEIQNASDTSADIVLPVASATGTGGQFTTMNIRVHMVRPNGGITAPGTALTP